MVFDGAAAESIQEAATQAKQDMNGYTTISAETAHTAVDLMKFFVDTKKLLYGFPLVTVPPASETIVGPSVSQHVDIDQQNECQNVNVNDYTSVVSNHSAYSNLALSSCSLKGSIVDLVIDKILMHRSRSISATRITQILRVKIFSHAFLFYFFFNLHFRFSDLG